MANNRVVGLGVPALACAIVKGFKLEASRRLFDVVIAGMTIANLSLMERVWRIVPTEHFAILPCTIVMLTAWLHCRQKPMMPQCYAALGVALDIIIHKS